MLKDIKFSYSYSTGEKNNSPMDFFNLALTNSIQFDLGLGYFSSTSINVLSSGFARFIVNGGSMRLYINEHISEDDYNLFKNGDSSGLEKHILDIYSELKKTLSERNELFFQCLSLLIQEERISVKIIVKKDGGLAHQKVGIFTDALGNKVSFTGSLNMTASALISNFETIECTCSWRGEDSVGKIEDSVKRYERMWTGFTEDVIIYDAKDFCQRIVKDYPYIQANEILEREEALSRKYVHDHKSEMLCAGISSAEPHFPNGFKPFEYQEDAYKAWVKNGKKGIFAMATGTGKTITSLNCVLHEYQNSCVYQALVLVPTIALVDQWKDEIASFGFNEIIEVSSTNPQWRRDLTQLKNGIRYAKKNPNFFIVSTYDSYRADDFQQLVNQLPEGLIVIADEAHNIGSKSVREAFKKLKAKRRIALSATPSRIYDQVGTSEIESLFDDKYPYVVSFPMSKAMECGRLMHYNYYPIIVHLDNEEMANYVAITKRLMLLYDANGDCKDKEKAERLLQERKRIMHKAHGKIGALRSIINRIGEESLKYCFVYVPEGFADNDSESLNSGESAKLIDLMREEINNVYPKVRCNTYIGEKSKKERQAILNGFSDGKIDVLLAMKCLDEGVDIPRTQYGIFASSTGNPRQFIQRRGRLLRKHDEKDIAYIYDMIVVPDTDCFETNSNFYNIEQKMVRQELSRVAYFAQLSSNYYTEVKPALEDIVEYYGLNLAELIMSVVQ